MRKRAELLTHLPPTTSQYKRPERGKTLAYKAHRTGGAARFPDSAVPKSGDVDLALLDSDDPRLSDLALHLLQAATQHEAQPLSRLQTVPGSGNILRLVRLSELHDISRFPSLQDFVSSCRWVQGAKEAAGNRSGTTGTNIGNAYLQGAFSDAAGLCLRDHPSGQQDRARLENNPGQGKALTILAHQWARTVYSMRKRATAVQMDTCSHG